jgi:hypothetical protein
MAIAVAMGVRLNCGIFSPFRLIAAEIAGWHGLAG